MEKNIFVKRGFEDSYYCFELIGFNEVYVQDNQIGYACYINRTFNSVRLKTKLEKEFEFESFITFSKSLYQTMIEAGDGIYATREDSSLVYDLDWSVIASSASLGEM